MVEALPVDVTQLRTDKMVADEIRKDLEPVFEQICKIFDKARSQGLNVNFNISPDQFGRFQIQQLNIVKPL